MKRVFQPLSALLGLLLLLGACNKEEDEIYTVIEESTGVIITNTIPTVTKYAPGETVRIELAFTDPEEVADIQLYQVVANLDSAVVATIQPNITFNPTLQANTQIVEYQVPASLANRTAVRLDIRTTFKGTSGLAKIRRINFNVANAPTIKFAATPATFRNGMTAARQSPGDIITYSVILNEGGINAIPAPPAAPGTAPLFKTLDSLTYFARIGSGPNVRIGTARLSSGVAATRPVDVEVPVAAVSQQVTYTFTSYSLQQTASVSNTVTIVAPTAYTQTKTGRLAAGPGISADSLAFNLRTGANELATTAAATKDLFLSTNGASAILNSANTTRLYRAPAALNPIGFYNTATVNQVATEFYRAGTAASNGAVVATLAANDVFLVRIRAAEYILLRVLRVSRSGINSAVARVQFEYKAI